MWTLLWFELRHISRDLLQLLLVAVVVPLLLVPFVSRSFQRVRESTGEGSRGTYFIAVDGKAPEPLAEMLRNQDRFRRLPLQSSPERALREGLIDAYLKVRGNSKSQPEQEKQRDSLVPRSVRERQPHTPVITVHYNSGRERSWQARDALIVTRNRFLKSVRDRYLKQHGYDPGQLFRFEEQNLATSEQAHLRSLSGLLPLLLVFVFYGAGSVTALDAIAGERERGSLATVLVSALTRRQIALGKWLCVLLIALSFGLFQFSGIYFSTRGLGGHGLFSLGVGGLLLLLGLGLTMAGQISALLLWISVRSHSFKQAQLLYMPALLIGAALAGAAWLETLPLRSVALLVPISGLSLAVRDTLLQQSSWFWIGLAIAIGWGWTALLLHWVAENLQTDDPPVSDEPGEQSRLQLKADILWFYATAGALMIILPGNFSALAGLRGQVLLNQGIFVLVAVGLLRVYRQPLRSSLRWGNTSALNWGICLAAAPLLHLCANSIAFFSNWLLPMSEETARQMTELLLPVGISGWELLFLIAVSPAICEEIAFRGTLLHALQQPRDSRSPSLATCLTIGLLFGCFHFSLQRLLPTAVIGSVLTWVTLRSGSIWPGMLLHFVNNALALGLHFLSIDYASLPAWLWFASWALLIYLLRGIQSPVSRGFGSTDGEHANSLDSDSLGGR